MKKIFNYLKEYYRNYFHLKLYSLTLFFLAFAIFIQYKYDFKEKFIEQFDSYFIQWLLITAFYLLPFLVGCGLIYLLKIRRSFVKAWLFWIKIIIGFALLGFDQSYFPNILIKSGLKNHDLYFYYTVYSWLVSMILLAIPLIILNIFIEKKRGRNLYGLLFRKFDITPYIFLLLFAALFLYVGSFLRDVHSYYPRYLHSGGANFAAFNSISEWVAVMIYELSYASSFISVELFFRGFLVLGFVRYLRGYAIIPMVACYCFLHFGKPLAETITSIFGGFILGAFVYKTRNIWGGIIIHIGIAMLMELFGYWRQ